MIEIGSAVPTIDQMERIIIWLNDPELMRYSEQRHSKHTSGTQLDYVYKMISNGWLYRPIYDDNRLIGTISASIDGHNKVADVGILLGFDYIGRGYGCIAWGIFCNQLAGKSIRKIEGGCMVQNKAMIRIFEKNGMRLEGTRRYHFQTGKDQYDDLVLYGKLT